MIQHDCQTQHVGFMYSEDMTTTHTVDLDGWIVTMTWDDNDTVLGPSHMEIHPSDPGNPPAGGLSSTVLRGIDFRAAKAAVQRQGTASADGSRRTTTTTPTG